jgi:hypothetical protein
MADADRDRFIERIAAAVLAGRRKLGPVEPLLSCPQAEAIPASA